MKRVIQLVLLLILVLIIIIFYKVYFKESNKAEVNNSISISEPAEQTENNIIKNLEYKINIEDNNEYHISAELSEITNDDGVELVLMKKVTARLTDKNNVTLFITSDEASYNNTNYYTKFENNVKIKYLDNIIYAQNMIINFENNSISIFKNVMYNGPRGDLKADNIRIDLITKKIDIFMNEVNESVVITSDK